MKKKDNQQKEAGELIELVREVIRQELNIKDSTAICIVESVNADGTLSTFDFDVEWEEISQEMFGTIDEIVEDFYNLGFIKTFDDFYKLESKKEKLMELEGFGEKSINNLLESAENSKSNSLERFSIVLYTLVSIFSRQAISANPLKVTS